MNKYANAVKLMEEYCGNEKDNTIALATVALSPNAVGNPRPVVRMVDAYYEDGMFYVSTDAKKNKTLETGRNNEVSVCGMDLFSAQGTAENLGWVKDERNAAVREKMKRIFSWFDVHGDEDNPDSIVLRITLTEATITDHERKYGDWQYKVDFARKEAK